MTWRANLLLLFLLLIFVLLGIRAVNLAAGDASKRAQVYANTRTAATLSNLRDEVITLRETVARIDNLSFNQLRQQLERLTGTLTRAQAELNMTYEEWRKLDLIVRANAEKFASLKTDIERLTAARQEQLSYAAKLFAEATTHDVYQSFFLGVLLSFPIGVISSVAASYLWERFRRRTLRSRQI